ncbi:MAG: hypothetical protein Kow0090_08770 [Myxococcota bacterium]
MSRKFNSISLPFIILTLPLTLSLSSCSNDDAEIANDAPPEGVDAGIYSEDGGENVEKDTGVTDDDDNDDDDDNNNDDDTGYDAGDDGGIVDEPSDGDDDDNDDSVCEKGECGIGEPCALSGEECALGLTCLSDNLCGILCSTDRDCGEGFVCHYSAEARALHCVEGAGLIPHGGECESGRACASGICKEGICEPTCNSVSDCAGGEICKNIELETEDENPASAAICQPALEDRLAVHHLYLGRYDISLSEITHPFYFTVPEDAVSVLIDADTPTGATIEIYRLAAPNGEPIFEKSDYSFPASGHLRLFKDVSPALALLSNDPQIPLMPGKYSVSFRHHFGGDTALEIRIYIKTTRDPNFRGNTTRINHFFAYIPPVGAYPSPDESNYAEHPFFSRVYPLIEQYFADAGIALEQKFFFTAGSGIETIKTTEGPNSDFRRLVTLPAAKAAPPGVNLFHVQWVTSDAPNLLGLTLNGFDGMIPGPFRVGTFNSGVAMAVMEYDWNPVEWYATVIFHETMHYFGLFHTTESNGGAYDPLADTPFCVPSNDKDGNGLLYPDECKEDDGYQLMFWATTQKTGRELTNSQKEIIFSHPLVATPDILSQE